ncbi:MAG: PIN domain-containing protein [Burkholderiales bacterium]
MTSVLPLDRDVVIALDSLPASFHGDPADRVIVATARTHAIPLATHDGAIRRSRLVKFWKPRPYLVFLSPCLVTLRVGKRRTA